MITVIEVSVAIIATLFLLLTVCAVVALFTMKKTVKKLDKVVDESATLIQDIQKKSEALDVFFQPMYALKKAHTDSKHSKSTPEKISEILECLMHGVILFNKIKNEVKGYDKTR